MDPRAWHGMQGDTEVERHEGAAADLVRSVALGRGPWAVHQRHHHP